MKQFRNRNVPNETFPRVARISLLLSRKRKEDEGGLKKELKKTLWNNFLLIQTFKSYCELLEESQIDG